MAKFLRKAKLCKVCGKEFLPYTTTQPVCQISCLMEYNSEKEVKKRVKQMKKDLLTHKDYLNILQVVFNKYIRIRDAGKPCISCGCKVTEGHASHLFSVGAYPNLRFNEFNVNLSCIECNLHKHGNIAEYTLRLPERIGQDNFNKLLEQRNEKLKLTIPEIKILIEKYKKLCRFS